MDEDPPATVTATVVAKAEDGVGGEAGHGEGEEEKMWRDLHTLLMETQVVEGKLVCGNCGHEYRIKDGIANFLLPNHLV